MKNKNSHFLPPQKELGLTLLQYGAVDIPEAIMELEEAPAVVETVVGVIGRVAVDEEENGTHDDYGDD